MAAAAQQWGEGMGELDQVQGISWGDRKAGIRLMLRTAEKSTEQH